MLEGIWHEQGGISSSSKGLQKSGRNREDPTLYHSDNAEKKPVRNKEEFLAKTLKKSYLYRTALACLPC